MIRRMLLIVAGLVLILFLFILVVGYSLSAPGHSGPTSHHFNGKTFTNPGGASAKGFVAVAQWILKRDQGPWTKNYSTVEGSKPLASSENLRITFVNHSTFLIQWNELNILTDPIWSERCSPISFAGPLRMRPPGISFDNLPTIDLVLLSHNHYDHLDLPTLTKLQELYEPVFIVPLGVGLFLEKKGIRNWKELDWWESTQAGLAVKAVPTQHFSGRGIFDRDKTLWCGYVLEHGGKKVYFAGDSGYGPFFKEIGKREGPIDIAMIPIGAYLPIWFMSPVHISPKEAVQVHKDVNSQQSIAMHFGTFPLADEGQGQAEEDLILALDSAGVSQASFVIPQEGNALDF